MDDSKDKDLEESSAVDSLPQEGLSEEELAAIARWQALAGDEPLPSPEENLVMSEAGGGTRAKVKTKSKRSSRVKGATIVDEPSPLLGLDESQGIDDRFYKPSEEQEGSIPVDSKEWGVEPVVAAADDESKEFPNVNPLGHDLVLTAEPDDRQGLMRWDEAINLEAQIESIIFASPKPISVSEIAEYLADDDGIEPDHGVIDNHIQQLQRLYKERNGGFRLEYDRGAGFQFRTVPAAAPLMERMFSQRQRPLSRAAHETLAIIAYRQPCTRADVEFIRGVDAGSIIKNLLERDLVTCVGRKEDSGRPMLFGTTGEFLRVFRIQSLNDLPPLSAFQPRSEEMIAAFQKIETGEEDVDVEGFIGDEDRDPIVITQKQLADFAASESEIDVREDALATAPPVQIRRAGASYDDEGNLSDTGPQDTEVAFEPGISITPRSGEDASRGSDTDQRPDRERAWDED